MSDHPFFFTWASQERAHALEITGGSGERFTTADGASWLDLGSLSYQAHLGHGHPRMIEAVRAQASRLCLAPPNAVYPEKVALAKELLALAPRGFTKVFFTLGGAEANENALKIARMVTGRYKTVSRYRSYHGASMGAVSLSGDYRRPPVEPGLVGAVHVLDLDGGRTESEIPRVLQLEGNVAAVFLEPVPGANGVLVPPPGYFASVRSACDAHGALLVVDEVLTGFGRCGSWLAIEQFDGVIPDMITISKGLTAGYGALGAVLVHERVAAHFEKNVLYGGLTQYAHPLGVAAGLEAIHVYRDDKLIERARSLAPRFKSAIEAIASRQKGVKATRAIGLLAGLDLEVDMGKLSAALRKRHVHAHVYSGTRLLTISPPLVVTESGLTEGLSLVEEAIAEAS